MAPSFDLLMSTIDDWQDQREPARLQYRLSDDCSDEKPDHPTISRSRGGWIERDEAGRVIRVVKGHPVAPRCRPFVAPRPPEAPILPTAATKHRQAVDEWRERAPKNDSDILPRKARNKGHRNENLATPALVWWRSATVARTADAWPDLSAENDNTVERPMAVRDVNPAPTTSAHWLMRAAKSDLPEIDPRIRARTRLAPAQRMGRPFEVSGNALWLNGRTWRVGRLEFTIERQTRMQRVGGQTRSFAVAAGTMKTWGNRPDDTGRKRESRATAAIAQRASSGAWYAAHLSGAALPTNVPAASLFMGLAVGRKRSGVRHSADIGRTIEHVLIDLETVALFRAAHPAHARVLDRSLEARRFADLAVNDNPHAGRRALEAAVVELGKFLAA